MLSFDTYAHVVDFVEASIALPGGRQLNVKTVPHITSDADEIYALSNHPLFKSGVPHKVAS